MGEHEETISQRFTGFRSPNTTPIPDEVFDELLADLSGAEIKVLLYICRRTFGWKKDSDNISLNQMLHGITRKDGTQLDRGVGLSKPTLLRTIKSLTAKNIVLTEQRESREKGHEPTNYRLNVIGASNSLGKNMSLGLSQNFTKPLVKKSYPQETGIQETEYKTVNGDPSIFKKLPPLDQPKAHTAYVARSILEQLGDRQSERFYRLVAAKIPEQVVRQALSEIAVDGARNPAKLFTHKMKLHALKQLKKQMG
jgi:Bacteriophage replication protein O